MATPGCTTHTIQGVKVEFPCKPYPSQLSMMYKIICGLERKQNCLLESPTGSGKSLALLCAALAWQKAQREKRQSEKEESKAEPECCCQCKTSSKYFEVGQTNVGAAEPCTSGDLSVLTGLASDGAVLDDDDDFKPSSLQVKTPRPHVSPAYEDGAQANPQIGGGGKCADTPCCSCQQQPTKKKAKIPKIYFGTRTHKQIAQIAKELGRTSYKHVNMCILGSREHTCVHPEVSRCSNKSEECKNRLEGSGCRFFDNVRKISHRGLKNLGLYEAWDLEDFVDFCKKQRACPYFSARQLKDGADIIFCPYNYLIDPVVRGSMEIHLKDEIVILDEAHNIEDTARDAGSFSVSKIQLHEGLEDLRLLVKDNINAVEHGILQDLLLGMMETIERNENQVGGGNYDNASKVLQGVDVVAQLTASSIGPEDHPRFVRAFNKLMQDDSDKRAEGIRKMRGPTTQVVDGLLTVFDFLFRNEMKYIHDYRVVLLRTLTSVKTVPTGGWLNKRSVRERKEWTFTMNFWCMNPAVAFSDVSSVVRSIVLTSGTLSPMDSFASELGVPFAIQLEAAHVVGKNQVWVGTISKGPRGGMLLGSYQHSETFAYQDELGQLLLGVCETVPHGVLCFLSSYKMMEKLSNRWKDTGLWTKIETLKTVMMEPKASDKVDFDLLMKRFYDVIRDSETPDKENEEVSCITGALFLAVCRGKVSEGLDFANNNARAVVAVGIPFPNVKDTQVNLKKEYNNKHSASKGLLTGNEWYEIQAYRALNQALGRCIRHRQDWGALILVDERYAKNPKRYTKGLSKWVRQRIQYYGFFNQAHSSLKEYTHRMIENPPANQTNISMFETTMDESMAADRMPLLQKPDFCNFPGSSKPDGPKIQTSMTEFMPPPVTPVQSKTSPVPKQQMATAAVPPTLLNVGGKLVLLSPPSADKPTNATTTINTKSKTSFPINSGAGPAFLVPVQLNGANPAPADQPTVVGTPAAANVNTNNKIVTLPDGKKPGATAYIPQPGTPRPVASHPGNQGVSPSPLFHSQAGGFCSSQVSTQNSPLGATRTNNLNKLDTTVLKGSLGGTQRQNHQEIDFPDDLDFAFNPSVASTQRTPVTPVNRANHVARKSAGQSTPVSAKSIRQFGGGTPGKPDITVPDSPPLFDSEEPDSGPMDTGALEGTVSQVKREKESDKDHRLSAEPGFRIRKVSVAEESCSVKAEPNEVKKETETTETSKTAGVRVSSRGRQIKPTLKSFLPMTNVKADADQGDPMDSTWTEQEESTSKGHNRSLSRRSLSRSRRNRSGLDFTGLDDSVNKGGGADAKDSNLTDAKTEKEESKQKEEESKSGGKRRRGNVTPTSAGATRKRAKGVVFDEDSDDDANSKVAVLRCESCGTALIQQGAGLTLDSHWSEGDGCVVQYLQCRECRCWEDDQGHVIGAKVIHATPQAGHFRVGQVWLSKESMSLS